MDTKIFHVKSELLIRTIIIYFLLFGFISYNPVCRVGVNACWVCYIRIARCNFEEKIATEESYSLRCQQISPLDITSSTVEMLPQLIKKNVKSSLLPANFLEYFFRTRREKTLFTSIILTVEMLLPLINEKCKYFAITGKFFGIFLHNSPRINFVCINSRWQLLGLVANLLTSGLATRLLWFFWLSPTAGHAGIFL